MRSHGKVGAAHVIVLTFQFEAAAIASRIRASIHCAVMGSIVRTLRCVLSAADA